jgi:acetyl esterase/lipase
MEPFLKTPPPEAQWRLLDKQVSKATPPCFLCHAEDDTVLPVAFTLRLREALKAAGVPADMHIFSEGGHGFGLRFTMGKPVAAWPDLFLAFAKRHGLLG